MFMWCVTSSAPTYLITMEEQMVNQVIEGIALLTDRELAVLGVLVEARYAKRGDRLIRRARSRRRQGSWTFAPDRNAKPGHWLSGACTAMIISKIRAKTGLDIRCKHGRYKLVVSA